MFILIGVIVVVLVILGLGQMAAATDVSNYKYTEGELAIIESMKKKRPEPVAPPISPEEKERIRRNSIKVALIAIVVFAVILGVSWLHG